MKLCLKKLAAAAGAFSINKSPSTRWSLGGGGSPITGRMTGVTTESVVISLIVLAVIALIVFFIYKKSRK